MTTLFRSAFCLLLLLPVAAQAEETPAHPKPETTIDATCIAWTNGCRLCRKVDEANIVCSTPGIACQPGAILCTAKQQETPSAGGSAQ